jgi:hypothetical protein
MTGKRRKEPAILHLREALEHFHDLVEGYREDLKNELTAARAEQEPYPHLIRALDRQIAALHHLEMMLDEQMWPEVVKLANTSPWIEHTRTRDFF